MPEHFYFSPFARCYNCEKHATGEIISKGQRYVYTCDSCAQRKINELTAFWSVTETKTT